MNPLLVVAAAGAVLLAVGWFYSRFLSRQFGEDRLRPTPAVAAGDGLDFVATPTPVVFAHHFASIAGAGPIIGPVIAICFGWLPALIWVVFGSLLIGGVHDYLATYMATREGGRSVATVVRRMLGTGPFIGMILFLLLSLALVCATFLNLSATALTSMVPLDRLDLAEGQKLFRLAKDGTQVIVGGIASTSVILITAVAPLLGWMYIRRKVAVWKCSLLAVVVCAVGVGVGLVGPVSVSPDVWKLLLAGYVLLAAGLPVWIFLQSRDFINVHILYVGLALLVGALVVAGMRGAGQEPAQALPAFDLATGSQALRAPFWPAFFITIACGAVSGFHSLCAGGTTCKQLSSERAARQVGYWGMLLEGFLAVCVIAVLMVGVGQADYLRDVHPKMLGLGTGSNPILAFALAVGNTCTRAFGIPKAIGTLAGMIMLEGFLVTTLDTAVRLMRYLLEELWRALRGLTSRAGSQPAAEARPLREGAGETAGSSGIPAPAAETAGRGSAKFYWINSGLAVGLTLLFAMSGGAKALWDIFATANQLLAAFVLGIGGLWLLRSGRRAWYVLLPALAMLVTTAASLVLLLGKYLPGTVTQAGKPVATGSVTLFVADIVLMALTAYLLLAGGIEAVRALRRTGGAAPAA